MWHGFRALAGLSKPSTDQRKTMKPSRPTERAIPSAKQVRP
jgi:hypothetical protein